MGWIPRHTRAASARRLGDLEERLRELEVARLESELRSPAVPIAPETRHRALTAAVSRMSLDEASWRSYRFGDRAWQEDAWRLYDITGQLRFVMNWVGSSVSRGILRVHKIDEHGNTGEVVDDPEVSQLSSGPLGTGDTRAEALRLAAIDLAVAGEAFLVAESGGGPDGTDLWWVVTGRQIKRLGDQITITRSPIHGGGTFVYRDGIDLILRCWTPHPANTDEPDSSVRSAIPDLRKLEAIRKREFAELDSRLAGAGLLLLPDSLDLPRETDDPEGADGFFQFLSRTMGLSLRDRSAAAAMVPIMVTGAAEDLEKVRHVTFWSEMSDALDEKWDRTIGSLAQSLDIPPEVLKGIGSSTNHWNAWAISDEAITVHIAPIAARIAAALTTGYLVPALEALGVADPTRYTYRFDLSLLSVRPNRSTDGTAYHDRMLISDDAARDAGAWTDAQAPDDAELLRRRADLWFKTDPAGAMADPLAREILGFGQPPITAGEPESSPVQPAPAPADPESTGPPPEPTAALALAAALECRRALELAGGRLVPHRIRDQHPGIPRHRLHTRVTPPDTARLDQLLAGAWTGIDLIASACQVDPVRLRAALDEHCRDLLIRGIALDDAELPPIVATLAVTP